MPALLVVVVVLCALARSTCAEEDACSATPPSMRVPWRPAPVPVVNLNVWHYGVDQAASLLRTSDLLVVLSGEASHNLGTFLHAVSSADGVFRDVACETVQDPGCRPMRPLTAVLAPSDRPTNPFVRLEAYYWESTTVKLAFGAQVGAR